MRARTVESPPPPHLALRLRLRLADRLPLRLRVRLPLRLRVRLRVPLALLDCGGE